MNVLKLIKFSVLFTGLFFAYLQSSSAQNFNTVDMQLSLKIPAIALIDFYSNIDRTYTFGYSNLNNNQVEQIVTPTTGDNTWLNYSSIVKPGATNYITVHISSGSLPADASLYLEVGPDNGAGGGNTGIAKPEVKLTYYPKVIIENIGSCYTGIGTNKGHQLKYKWKNPESYQYSLNYENSETIAVVYTIASNE